MDQAIVYNTTLMKVNRILDRLEDIGLNVQKYKELRDSIVLENKQLIDNDLWTGILEVEYNKSINKLEKLYVNLLQYEVYSKVASITELIKISLMNGITKEEEFNKLREMILELVNKLNFSGTLDYEVEGPIIEDVYKMIYEFIKQEILVLGKSSTLTNLKDNEYIDREVRKDLQLIDLTDEKNYGINIRKNEIDASGMDASYADEKLITAIVNVRNRKQKRRNLKESLRDLEDYESDLNYTVGMAEISAGKIEKNKEQNNNDRKKDIKSLAENIAFLAVNLGVSVGIVIGLLFVWNKSTYKSKTEYMTNTITYDTNLDYTIEQNYKDNVQDGVYLNDYSLWYQRTDNGQYYRVKRTYNITDLYNVYSEADLTSYNTNAIKKCFETDISLAPSVEKYEYKLALEAADTYQSIIRLIEIIDVDENDSRIVIEADTINGIMSVMGYLLVIFILIESPSFGRYSNTWIPLLLDIRLVLSNIKSLLKSAKNNKQYDAQLKEISNELTNFVAANRDTIAKVEELIPQYKQIPEFNEEIEIMENALNKIKNIEKKLVR